VLEFILSQVIAHFPRHSLFDNMPIHRNGIKNAHYAIPKVIVDGAIRSIANHPWQQENPGPTPLPPDHNPVADKQSLPSGRPLDTLFSRSLV
jgi:hypothetical protein